MKQRQPVLSDLCLKFIFDVMSLTTQLKIKIRYRIKIIQKEMIFLRNHLDEGLQLKYLIIKILL